MSEEPTQDGAPEDLSLDQSEIDRLMAQGAANTDGAIYKFNGERFTDEVKVDFYDFRNPAFLSDIEMRQLKIRYEQFARYASSRLSMFLRMDTKISLEKLETVAYEKFTQSITQPVHISIFQIESLTGVGILSFGAKPGIAIVNRMLGGKGITEEKDRNLTEIEMALLDEVIQIVLNEWCAQWASYKKLRATLIGRENDGRYLQTAPKDAVMLTAELDLEIGETKEKLRIGLPNYMLEPLVKDLQAKLNRFNSIGRQEKKSKWIPSYSEIEIPVTAEWEGFELSVQELLTLRVGDIFTMPRNTLEKTQIRFMDTTYFEGEVGIDKDHIGVKIRKKLEREDNPWKEYQKLKT